MPPSHRCCSTSPCSSTAWTMLQRNTISHPPIHTAESMLVQIAVSKRKYRAQRPKAQNCRAKYCRGRILPNESRCAPK
eukprot:2574993-Pleurochrysis_carterae.AAC.1